MSQVAEHTGRVIGGRYRLITPAGAGSSASVYRAMDSRLSRHVAVKMLHGALASDPTFLKRFRAEAKAAAALNHPHIVRVFDWGDDEAGPFLVMEYLGGGSLAAMIGAGTRLSPGQAAKVGLDAAGALAYAHRRGLVHRDIKPGNILFDEDGRAAIADFGLARAFAEAAWTEPAGTLFGTARYTSPEQAQGRPAEGASDVYSLALSLYEAVAGDIPFHADSTMSLVMARVGARVEPPEEAGVVGVVIEGAMAPEAGDRIDAARMLEELQTALRNLPAPAPLPLVGTVGGLAGDADDATILGREVRTSGAVYTSSSVRAGDADDATVLAGAVYTSSSVRAAASPGRRMWSRRAKAISTVVLTVCIVGGGIAAAVVGQVFVPKLTVPSVRGDTVAAAQATLHKRGFTLAVSNHRFVKGVAEGGIAAQSPASGAKLARGDAVEVVVSKGSPFVAVPGGLVGESQTTASAQLGAAGFRVATTGTYSSSVPANDVISLSPAEGTRWGDTITLVVSEGPQPVAIPKDLTGEEPATATKELQSLGLAVATEQQNSSTVPDGKVIGTDPAEGQTAHIGDTVTLYVSKGPVMVQVPDVSGDSVQQAQSVLQGAGLSVQNVYGPPNDSVYTTYPSAGSSVAQGTGVSLYTIPGGPGKH